MIPAPPSNNDRAVDQTVSAVIPCYNGERFLAETLESVLAQTRPCAEVLVVDDGSTDASAALAESFGAPDGPGNPRGVPVRVIRQENQGESVARNRGVGEAVGEWVAFCDADDLWEPGRLAALLTAAGPGDVAAHNNVRRFGAEETVTRIEDAADRYDVESLACWNHFVTPSAVIVRRAACPRFPEWTRQAEDLVFFLELVRRGPVAFVPAALTRYRRHPGNQSGGRDAPFRWHATVLEWLRRSPDLDPAAAGRVRARYLAKLTAEGRELLFEGDEAGYRAYQGHLRPFADESPRVASFLKEPNRPRAVYRAEYGLRRLVRAARKLARPAR